MVCVPAHFTRLEVTLDSYMLFGAEAAGVCVVVTDITLLTVLDNQVSTDGLITDWTEHTDKHTHVNTHTVYNYLQ